MTKAADTMKECSMSKTSAAMLLAVNVPARSLHPLRKTDLVRLAVGFIRFQLKSNIQKAAGGASDGGGLSSPDLVFLGRASYSARQKNLRIIFHAPAALPDKIA